MNILLIGWNNDLARSVASCVIGDSRYSLYVASRDRKDSYTLGTASVKSFEVCTNTIDIVVSTIPIWYLPAFLIENRLHRVKRLIAISSSSVIEKATLGSKESRRYFSQFIEGEKMLADCVDGKETSLCILRPTMLLSDNRCAIRLIIDRCRRLGFVPIIGDCKGLRAPIHTDDLAQIVIALTIVERTGTFLISGGVKIRIEEVYKLIANELGIRSVRISGWVASGAAFVIDRLMGLTCQDYISRQARSFDYITSSEIRDLCPPPRDISGEIKGICRSVAGEP